MTRNLGGRPKKVKVELTESSATDIISKAYSELEDVRQKALSFYGKTVKDTRENSSIALVGKTGAEFLKIAANATLNKVNISKMVLDHVSKKSGGGSSVSNNSSDEVINTQKAFSNEQKEEMKKILAQVAKDRQAISVEESLNNIEQKEIDKMIIPIKPKDNEK